MELIATATDSNGQSDDELQVGLRLPWISAGIPLITVIPGRQ